MKSPAASDRGLYRSPVETPPRPEFLLVANRNSPLPRRTPALAVYPLVQHVIQRQGYVIGTRGTECLGHVQDLVVDEGGFATEPPAEMMPLEPQTLIMRGWWWSIRREAVEATMRPAGKDAADEPPPRWTQGCADGPALGLRSKGLLNRGVVDNEYS
jgi:hypothetical protein